MESRMQDFFFGYVAYISIILDFMKKSCISIFFRLL